MTGVEPIGRGLARLRDCRWDTYAPPGANSLDVPLLTTIKPPRSSPNGPAEAP